MPDRGALDALLRPTSVAMVGASADVTRIGGQALRHLREVGFAGEIFPINLGRSEVQGIKAWSTIETFPSGQTVPYSPCPHRPCWITRLNRV